MRQLKALSILFTFALQAADTTPVLRGYSQQASTTELQWEKKFREIP